MKKILFASAISTGLLAVLPLVAGTGHLAAQGKKMKVILDTDIGDDIDDAWALAFLISHQEFQPLGVTIAHGNTPGRAPIACKMLYITGHEDIPVILGRQTDHNISYQFYWAEDFKSLQPKPGRKAAEFIVEQAKKYPGEVTLLAVGPLENVADALRLEPQLGKYLKRVVFMSGCVHGTADSATPVPEYNVYAAKEDAQLVYAAGLPLTIVPLDSTTRVRLKDEEREQVRKHDSALTRAVEALYRLWLESPSSRMTLHDQLAVAETASPSTFFGKKETVPLYVDDKGFTRIDPAKGKPATVCLEPKRDEFLKYYISQLVGQSFHR